MRADAIAPRPAALRPRPALGTRVPSIVREDEQRNQRAELARQSDEARRIIGSQGQLIRALWREKALESRGRFKELESRLAAQGAVAVAIRTRPNL